MPVLSVSLPRRREAALHMAALKRGIEADHIDHEGDVSYVDLVGARDKINEAAMEAGPVTVLDRSDSVPHGEAIFTLVGRIGFDD